MVHHRHLRWAAGGVSIVVGLALTTIVPASADNGVDSTALRNAVTVNGILAHEQALQAIANANGGTRAAGTPGFEASGDTWKACWERPATASRGRTSATSNSS